MAVARLPRLVAIPTVTQVATATGLDRAGDHLRGDAVGHARWLVTAAMTMLVATLPPLTIPVAATTVTVTGPVATTTHVTLPNDAATPTPVAR